MAELTPEEMEQEIKNNLTMVENELCFGGNWEDAKARISRCRSHLDKTQLAKSQDVCPECYGTGEGYVTKCTICQGSGKKPLDDEELREKIFETIYYHKFPNAVRYKVKPVLHDIASEELADQILALWPKVLSDALKGMLNVFDRALPEGSIGESACRQAREAVSKATIERGSSET